MNSLPDPWQIPRLIALLEVVREGSFTKAAVRLDVTKSVVSNHVRRLEEFVGGRLLERSSRSLRLTEAGERLLPHAEALANSWTEGIADTRSLFEEPSGELVVTTTEILARDVVTPAIAALVKEYPELSVELIVTDNKRDILDERVDVAVRMGPMVDSELVALRLGVSPDILLAAPSLIAERGRPIHPTELIDWPWIRHRSLPARRHVSSVDGETFVFSSSPRLVTDSGLSMLLLLETGTGVGIFPSMQAQASIDAGRLERLLPEWSDPNVEIFALYPSRRLQRSSVSALLKALKRTYQAHQGS